MRNPWTMKMEQYTRFSDTDRTRLDELVLLRQIKFEAREDIVREGDRTDQCHLIVAGLACRYKVLSNGNRQIMAFLVPGDLCDAEVFILKEMDHTIGTLTPTTVALIPGLVIEDLLSQPVGLAKALWWGTLTDLGVLRERIVDHGRRDAYVRIAHLIYELLVRYRIVGLANDDSFDFPMTQVDLADATGLSPVHVNRVLQRMREEQLILLRNRCLTVAAPDRLKEIAGFSANYLHLNRAHDKHEGLDRRTGDLV
jgi:CRP-like cAMP-binding protein